MLEALTLLLAIAGAIALSWRFLLASGAALLGEARSTSAARKAEISASRGDVTAVREARDAQGRARSDRRLNAFKALVWGAWLLTPFAVGGTTEIWALAAPLWLLGRPKADGSREPGKPPQNSDPPE